MPEKKLSNEKWAEDITYLTDNIEKVHKNPYHSVSKTVIETAFSDLKGKIPRLSENEIVTELARIIAMIGDGHSALNIFNFHNGNGSTVKFHILPVKLYIFTDGVFVIGAAPQYASLTGKKVLKINGHDVKDVFEAAEKIVPRDNEYTVKSNLPEYAVVLEFLNGLGFADNTNGSEITVAGTGGTEETISLSSIELENMNHEPGNAGEKSLPLYMRNQEKNYWYEYLSESKTLYINYKRVLIDPADSLSNFCKRIEEFVKNNGIERTVIDIRNNVGGNNATCQAFVEMVSNNPGINRKGRLFVIIGRQTFSAASYLATRLEFNTKAIFAGEPTGASPNHYGDNSAVILPNSKIDVRLSTVSWENSFPGDNRKYREPQLKAEVSSGDYFSGRDPVMEAIINYKPGKITEGSYNKKAAGTYVYSPIQNLVLSEDGKYLKMNIDQFDFLGRNVSFISTTLYPVSDNKYDTDIDGLTVTLTTGGLKLNYRGVERGIEKAGGKENTFSELVKNGKFSEAADVIRELRKNQPEFTGISEYLVNSLGYTALKHKDFEGAITLFKLNCDLYPDSFNAYDSLGEAYMLSGDFFMAAENYRHSVEVNPQNENGKKMLEKLTR
jgi:tetratricopeptide (TPR) repeat protein/DNA-binding CsgD family transcriptional regulator